MLSVSVALFFLTAVAVYILSRSVALFILPAHLLFKLFRPKAALALSSDGSIFFGSGYSWRIDWREWVQVYSLAIVLAYSAGLGILKAATGTAKSTYEIDFSNELDALKAGRYIIFLNSVNGIYFVEGLGHKFSFLPNDVGYVARHHANLESVSSQKILYSWLTEH